MLYTLKDAPPKLRKAILQNASNDLIKVINEIAYNVINGNHEVSKQQLNQLKKHKMSLRSLVNNSKSLASKRKVLIQSGSGFIPILLSLILNGILGRMLNNDHGK